MVATALREVPQVPVVRQEAAHWVLPAQQVHQVTAQTVEAAELATMPTAVLAV
jgi:hypothetical protein